MIKPIFKSNELREIILISTINKIVMRINNFNQVIKIYLCII